MFDVDTTVHLRFMSVVIFERVCCWELRRLAKIAVLLDSASFCTLVGLGFTAY